MARKAYDPTVARGGGVRISQQGPAGSVAVSKGKEGRVQNIRFCLNSPGRNLVGLQGGELYEVFVNEVDDQHSTRIWEFERAEGPGPTVRKVDLAQPKKPDKGGAYLPASTLWRGYGQELPIGGSIACTLAVTAEGFTLTEEA